MGKGVPNQKKKAERNACDKYLTPPSVVQQLLDCCPNVATKDATIYEPCASPELTIGNVLRKNGFTNITENIYKIDVYATDFLSQPIKHYDTIITNTPYGDKNITAFILKMKQVATHRIVALYPLSILQGIKRFKAIWSDKEFALKEVLLFVRPPFLSDTFREDGCYFTGMTFYAWFIWEKGFQGDVSFRHINNQQFCLTDDEKNRQQSLKKLI